MNGISYIIDEKGRRTHAVIDLKRNDDLWEELEALISYLETKDEPRIPLEEVGKKLKKL